MDGDEIQKAFEAKHEKFLNKALKTQPAESAAVSVAVKPLEERVDSLARNVGPMNGKETKRTPLEDGLTALEKMAKEERVYRNFSKDSVVIRDENTPEELQTRFTYHKPDELKVALHRDVRMKCWALAEFLCKECPASRELSIALTKVEEVMLWANAAIARRG